MQTASTPDQVQGMLSPKIALPGLPALVRPGGLGRRLIGGVRGTESRIAGTRLHEALLECLEPARPAVVLILNDQTPGIGFRGAHGGGRRHGRSDHNETERERELSHPSPPYSAASLTTSARATFAAQNLNSGIFPNGSSAGLVSRLAAASTKAKGMNTTPSGTPSSWRAESSTVPRRVVTRTMSPGATPSRAMVPRESEATAEGSSASSTAARRVIAPVCQCSSWRPVVRMNGYSASGISSGAVYRVATSLARPFG